MSLPKFTIIWLVITFWLSLEYLAGNGIIKFPGVMLDIQCFLFNSCSKFDPRPGKSISYYMGWLGFGIMALTNIYIIRKRVLSLQKLGNLQNWLNWHIFFGLLGPTLILFHCNFKVRGLVGISFWSMMVSFTSGIVGRYFYMQLLYQKGSLKTAIDSYEAGFVNYVKISGRGITEDDMIHAKGLAFFQATGGVLPSKLNSMGIFEFLTRAVSGDVNSRLRLPETPWGGSKPIRRKLRDWAVLKRKLIFMHYYKILFGYWHTFHAPFAIFMYIVAVIHIVSSLIFKVH